VALKEKEPERVYTRWGQLPLTLDRQLVSDITGLGLPNVDVLFHREDFPKVQVGRRYLVGREAFRRWLNKEGI